MFLMDQIGLLSDINLAHHPGLVNLLMDGETIEDLIRLSPEQILLRWVNYHLARSSTDRQIHNFGEDIKVRGHGIPQGEVAGILGFLAASGVILKIR